MKTFFKVLGIVAVLIFIAVFNIWLIESFAETKLAAKICDDAGGAYIKTYSRGWVCIYGMVK